MADYPIGKVSISNKGAYNSSTGYTPLDLVSNRGGAFLCKQNCTGVEPGVSAGWGNYWVSVSKGIYSVSANSSTSGTVTVTITFSDMTTYAFSYTTSALADNQVTTSKINDSAVTSPKIADGAVSTVYTGTIATGWAGSTAPYTQTVAISGILATDVPIVDLMASSTFSTAEAQIEAWGLVYRVVASANLLTFYATDPPAVAIPIQVRCIRK